MSSFLTCYVNITSLGMQVLSQLSNSLGIIFASITSDVESGLNLQINNFKVLLCSVFCLFESHTLESY